MSDLNLKICEIMTGTWRMCKLGARNLAIGWIFIGSVVCKVFGILTGVLGIRIFTCFGLRVVL